MKVDTSKSMCTFSFWCPSIVYPAFLISHSFPYVCQLKLYPCLSRLTEIARSKRYLPKATQTSWFPPNYRRKKSFRQSLLKKEVKKDSQHSQCSRSWITLCYQTPVSRKPQPRPNPHPTSYPGPKFPLTSISVLNSHSQTAVHLPASENVSFR